MKNFGFYDGDLSEDFLDEHAQHCIVKTSPTLLKNMEDSPFHRHIKSNRASDPSCFGLVPPHFECFKDALYDKSKLQVCNKTTHIQKWGTTETRRPSKLQLDIKDLLHKMSRIRSCCDQSEEGPQVEEKVRKQSAASCPCGEVLVTMKDINSAE
ncbi:unnamed protein product [Moneuplotes crassus]|uniref:Uncharacterized protein n=1 Tax=Euplotes crassus TaxID=5936 RepID=A0AAD2DAZ2_EUPCR|nr:unnamed protein product [Moneuplotes crassus]